MPGKATVLAVSLGAMAAQLPMLVLQGGVSSLQATWGWSTTPQCIWDAGTCSETGSNKVDAGASCTPVCGTNKVPSDRAAINCLESDGKEAPDNGWWIACGLGTAECKSQMAIGELVTCKSNNTGAAIGSARGLGGASWGAMGAAGVAAVAGILGVSSP